MASARKIGNMVKGKVALITGSSGGFGQEFTKVLLQNGAKGVAMLDIYENDDFEDEMIKQFGQEKMIFIPTDVTSGHQLKEAYEETIAKYKNLDIVINNAGIVNEDNWEKCLNLNLLGLMKSMYMAMQIYLPKYRQGRDSYIVNIASMLGLTPIPARAVYSASKYAVVSMSMTYGSKFYFDKYGVKLLTICPGYTATPILKNIEDADFGDPKLKETAIGSIQKPETVGNALIEAISEGTNGSVWLSQHNKNEMINMNEVFGTLREKTRMILN